MKLTKLQLRMLRTLGNDSSSIGVPVGLSDLSNCDFTELVAEGFITLNRSSTHSILAHISAAGRTTLAQGGGE